MKNNKSSFKKVSSDLFKKWYWDNINIFEFLAFTVKLAIIIPGLLFNKQIWWLYIFALLSSIGLIYTSIKKHLPTIIYFNVGWSVLAIAQLVKHFFYR
jgi:hypothetical protein